MFLILLLICQWTSLLSWRQPSFRVFNTQRRWNSIHSSLTRTYLTQEPIAVLFDCDGVIAETEEFHRHAFNNAFKGFQLTFGSTNESVYWDVPFCK